MTVAQHRYDVINTATEELIGSANCAFGADTLLMHAPRGVARLEVMDRHRGTLLDLRVVPVAHVASSYGADLFMLVRAGDLSFAEALARLHAAFPEVRGEPYRTDEWLAVTVD
ncbi:hypothetical protein [Deinococcus soli (ex Cha et al. 2016)]|uniref:Uncharacterized protein n=2 Tax=Deinococcus soli (ex Cha et al. 2016) TaxID=1309411 RepID=A0ACC6KGW3_9DEIO|nr:hypothetical protein [Deinococcus soli (ex Cha et al. 2016)]MDR6218913.1 hypothetical protein [Deinococcus soli (ex Cha et al. 2016)]MDR6328710.1 hypothetical protein [Deinococcus soli (ex Cha et al. 2016)]MDR6751803.1 hypothetical protein [Deinococcus soli (ex Cha et al. 2016)]